MRISLKLTTDRGMVVITITIIDRGNMCKIFNKDGRLFATHSLTYFNKNAFLSTWVLIKIRKFSQLLSTTGCSTKTIILFIDILWASIFIINFIKFEILAWKNCKIHFSELLIEISNISKVMVSTEHPVVKQLLKL